MQWFGGEPLLELDQLRSVQTAINLLAKDRGLEASGHVLTNGTLLTKDVAGRLVQAGVTCFQITIEATREQQNSARRTAAGDSFDVIMRNVTNALQVGDVQLVIMVADERPPSLDFLIEALSSVRSSPSLRLKVKAVEEPAAPYPNLERRIAVHHCRAHLATAGFSVVPEEKIKGLCFKRAPATIVFAGDGKLFKCADRFDSSEEVAVQADGRLVWNALGDLWNQWSVFDDPKCKQCRFLPVCFGGCPRQRFQEACPCCLANGPDPAAWFDLICREIDAFRAPNVWRVS